jgi:hypothetical protein
VAHKRKFKRGEIEQFRISAVRQMASRSRWGVMTVDQRKAATLKAREASIAAAAKRRQRKVEVGEDKRTSGNLIGGG